MAKAMREQGYNTAKIQSEVMKLLRADPEYRKVVAENTKAYKQEVKEIIKETVNEAKRNGDKLVAEAGDMAWNDDLRVWKAHDIDLNKPNSMSNLYKAFGRQTKDQLKNLTLTTGFKGTTLGTTGVLNMYQRSMDLALLKLSTGTFSYEQAVKDVVHQLAQSGLRTIDYASGRSYHIDTASRMVVRTASSQLAGKITEMNIQKTGVELVYVDAHAGARPEHAEWQGQVYSYKGGEKKYPDFVDSTGYGSVTGLKGVNCTHNFYPYWEGSPIPEYNEPDPITVNGKEYSYYEATQEQRKQERAIRATKREIEANQALGYDTKELSAKLRMQTKSYNSFSDAVGINPRRSATRVQSATIKTNAPTPQAVKIQTNTIENANKIATKAIAEQYDHRIKDKGVKFVEYGKLDENTKKQVGADFSGIDIKLANASAKQFKKLSSEYETTCQKIKTESIIGTTVPAYTENLANISQSNIVLNKTIMKNYDKFIERMDNAVQRGRFPNMHREEYEKYVMTHEFTHTLIDFDSQLKNYVNAETKHISEARKEIKEVYTRYSEEVKKVTVAYKESELKALNTFNEEDWKESQKLYADMKAITISEYAKENINEFTAEAFTDAKIGSNPSKYSLEVLNIIDKYFKKTIG